MRAGYDSTTGVASFYDESCSLDERTLKIAMPVADFHKLVIFIEAQVKDGCWKGRKELSDNIRGQLEP